MKKLLSLFITLTLSLGFISCANASNVNNNNSNYTKEGFFSWLNSFKSKAIANGVDERTFSYATSGVKLNQKSISLDHQQKGGKVRLDDYLNRVVSADRVARGKQKLKENYAVLDDIEKRFGVDKKYIVALWAVESSFGEYQGDFYIPEVLATLAYEGRRRDFFEKELINSLKILQQGHIRKENFKGSWAGAMGHCQFMPTSFFSYAFDYDGDGRKDIWTNKNDALASIANYMRAINWNDDLTWGRQARLTKSIPNNLMDLSIKKPLSYWKQMGVTKADGTPLPDLNIMASLIAPEGKSFGNYSKVYIVYDNFGKIMHWNNSSYFAISVGKLADAIGG